jgi:hypothetical protein
LQIIVRETGTDMSLFDAPGDQPQSGIQVMGRQISRPEGTATFSLFIVIPAPAGLLAMMLGSSLEPAAPAKALPSAEALFSRISLVLSAMFDLLIRCVFDGQFND